jgi:hypothetical protein
MYELRPSRESRLRVSLKPSPRKVGAHVSKLPVTTSGWAERADRWGTGQSQPVDGTGPRDSKI